MKKPKGKKRSTKYDKKLAINDTFENVLNVAVRSAKVKPEKAKVKAK